MPDVREKLVELLDEIHHKQMGATYQERIGAIASHLIANGVTFAEDTNVPTNGVTIQRWIPVTERFPENNRPVLVYLKNYTIQGGYVVHIGSYDTAGFWFLRTQPGIASFPVREWVVTHWMPLPEAPKGDD